MAELSRQHGVAESLIHKWKAQFLERGKAAFKHGNAKTPDKALQAENEQLKKVLGQKVFEIEILKKLSSSAASAGVSSPLKARCCRALKRVSTAYKDFVA